VVDYNKTNKMQ